MCIQSDILNVICEWKWFQMRFSLEGWALYKEFVVNICTSVFPRCSTSYYLFLPFEPHNRDTKSPIWSPVPSHMLDFLRWNRWPPWSTGGLVGPLTSQPARAPPPKNPEQRLQWKLKVKTVKRCVSICGETFTFHLFLHWLCFVWCVCLCGCSTINK